jgi:hypothetical protein
MNTGETREGDLVAYSAADAAEQVMAPLRGEDRDHGWYLSRVFPVPRDSREYEEAMRLWRFHFGLTAGPEKVLASDCARRACSWSAAVLTNALRCNQTATPEEAKFISGIADYLRQLGAVVDPQEGQYKVTT